MVMPNRSGGAAMRSDAMDWRTQGVLSGRTRPAGVRATPAWGEEGRLRTHNVGNGRIPRAGKVGGNP